MLFDKRNVLKNFCDSNYPGVLGVRMEFQFCWIMRNQQRIFKIWFFLQTRAIAGTILVVINAKLPAGEDIHVQLRSAGIIRSEQISPCLIIVTPPLCILPSPTFIFFKTSTQQTQDGRKERNGMRLRRAHSSRWQYPDNRTFTHTLLLQTSSWNICY